MMLEQGHLKWAKYASSGAGEGVKKLKGHPRQKGQLGLVSELIKGYNEPKEGNSAGLQGKNLEEWGEQWKLALEW